MTKEEKELYRFVEKPAYRKKILAKIRREQDSQYEKRIKMLRSEKDELISQRKKEIQRLSKTRWERIGSRGIVLVNLAEGKVKLNQAVVRFSDIAGAELNIQFSNRIITQTTEKSKKHVSLGGAVLGGLVSGGLGAVVGGVGLGKTTTTGTSVSTEIPICTHIGVNVLMKGYVSEIVLLSRAVEESSSAFAKAEREAQEIIATLHAVANISVPTECLRIEDEPSVREFDEEILNIEQEIEKAIGDKSTYKLPNIYRTVEQRDMSDGEYLAYLDSQALARDKEKKVVKEKVIKEKVIKEKKEKDKHRVKEKKVIKAKVDGVTAVFQHPCVKENIIKEKLVKEKKVKTNIRPKITHIVNKSGVMIRVVCGWGISLFALMFVLASLIQGGIASAFIFGLSALSINPWVYKCLKSKMSFLNKKMAILLFIVTFIIGIVVFTTSTPSAMVQDLVII